MDAMTRTRVRRRRATAVAVAGAIWLVSGPVAEAVGLGDGPEAPRAAPPPSTYVVRAGDTLWSIAVDVRPGVDPRPVVDAIARANDVDPASLVPGQELVVPTSS